ncbi:MAG: hypothetical protein S0880_22470 [Actinomycetota bacterium]|nr:hypothetical protein [Actinomycetota bacterium]
MPWCDTCERWHAPNALTEDGRCPVCGEDVGAPRGGDRAAAPASAGAAVDESAIDGAAAPGRSGVDEAAGERVGFPWHFKLLLVSLVAYLGWRAVEGVQWVIQQF